MSLFDANFIEIKLYYTFKNKGAYNLLVILSDEKAEKLLEDSTNKEKVETLTTKWTVLNWHEQNLSVKQAYSKVNEQTGEKIFDHVAYRDVIIKSCLKQWDIKVNGQDVPVTPEAIDKLPGDVVMSLYSKYEKLLDYSEEELKN